ncbi:hypothetical protein HNR44_000513 [Geomicrobium halophilum]|uniref:Uncharacterized protein n=1 Tax=Geomicrobium halophilum TaxID=549000 RepID=A0A841PLK3_9BACL|nr:hypothetical protein [Geomicrobium halophilum]
METSTLMPPARWTYENHDLLSFFVRRMAYVALNPSHFCLQSALVAHVIKNVHIFNRTEEKASDFKEYAEKEFPSLTFHVSSVELVIGLFYVYRYIYRPRLLTCL